MVNHPKRNQPSISVDPAVQHYLYVPDAWEAAGCKYEIVTIQTPETREQYGETRAYAYRASTVGTLSMPTKVGTDAGIFAGYGGGHYRFLTPKQVVSLLRAERTRQDKLRNPKPPTAERLAEIERNRACLRRERELLAYEDD